MTRGDSGPIISAPNSDVPPVPVLPHDKDCTAAVLSELMSQYFYKTVTYFSETTLTRVQCPFLIGQYQSGIELI